MKHLNFIKDINILRLINSQIYFTNFKSGELYAINDNLTLQNLVTIKVNRFVFQSNSIVFQSDNTIYRLENDAYFEIINADEANYYGLQEYLFENKVVIALTKKNDWIPNSMILLEYNNEIEILEFAFNCEICFKDFYFSHNKDSVFSYTKEHKKRYQIDVTNFGRNIVKHPETGEVLWDKPNEIKEALLADDKNIYVPLTGGQLLALDAETGEKIWMFDNEKLGMYSIFGDKIYKGDGKSILIINASTGQIEKELYFKNVPILKEYIPAGPFLVYDDIIISTDVLYGKICLLNRQTLEVEEFFSLNNKLVNSKDAIIWNDNKLYVLDIDRTLHIFEKTENESV